MRFTREFLEAGKPVGVICHGPWTLIEADVVRGKTITSYPSLRTDLLNAGANWVDREVVVDNGLVSSRRPDDLPAFCDKIVEELAEGRYRSSPHRPPAPTRPPTRTSSCPAEPGRAGQALGRNQAKSGAPDREPGRAELEHLAVDVERGPVRHLHVERGRPRVDGAGLGGDPPCLIHQPRRIRSVRGSRLEHHHVECAVTRVGALDAHSRAEAPDDATITCQVSPAKARSPSAVTSQGTGEVVAPPWRRRRNRQPARAAASA